MTDLMNPPAATGDLSGMDVDDLQSLRRKHTADYLKAREAYEDDPTDFEAWLSYESWEQTMVYLLVSSGECPDGITAIGELQALTFPQGAERVVELWMGREDLWGVLSWDQSHVMVCAVADSVRDWVAEGGELGQMPMREWTAPYLAVAR